MRTRSRLMVLVLAAFIAVLSLTGCAKPVDAPSATLEEVDVAVRRVLQGYLDALKRGSYEEAAGYWSPTAKVTAESLKVPGVTEWHFISSEMIDSTATSAHVQLSFSVKVAPNSTTPYTDGRNVRYVRLASEQGGWKILTMATSP